MVLTRLYERMVRFKIPVYYRESVDDTALTAVSIPNLESLLHAVQVEASLDGL